MNRKLSISLILGLLLTGLLVQGVTGLLEATAEGARDRLAEWFEN